MPIQEAQPLVPLLVLALVALALAGCSKPVVVDLTPRGSSTVTARARFDWSLGKGTGRWYVRVVPNPTPREKTIGCIQRGRCDDLGEDACRVVPTKTLDEPSSSYCSSPEEYAGTHAFTLRLRTDADGEGCEGVVLACADL